MLIAFTFSQPRIPRGHAPIASTIVCAVSMLHLSNIPKLMSTPPDATLCSRYATIRFDSGPFMIKSNIRNNVNPHKPLDIFSRIFDIQCMMKREKGNAMQYDMTKEQAVVIMRALAYAQEFGTEYANAEFQIEYYNIGAAFDLLDEDQIEEMDTIINDCEQIIAEYDFENGYQRSNMG